MHVIPSKIMASSNGSNIGKQLKETSIFNTPSLGIIIYDNSGNIGIMNPFALALFEYTEAEILGQPIETLIPIRHLQDKFRFPKGGSIAYSLLDAGVWSDRIAISKTGKEINVEISLNTLNEANEQGVMVLLNDISLRKRSEEEIVRLNNELEIAILQRNNTLKETLRELEVARDKLLQIHNFQKAILDSAGMIIVVADEYGTIKLFNPEAEKKTGYSESEMLNKPLLDLFIDPKIIEKKRKETVKDFGKLALPDFETFAARVKKTKVFEEEYKVVRKDGFLFPVSVTITCIRNASDEVIGFIGIAFDISIRKNAEESLHASLKKEKEISQMKSNFISIASHEFRTPLSIILSSTYLIGKYVAAEEQHKREMHLKRIVSSANLLTHILDEFLSAGRIDEGKITVKPSYFNVVKLIKSIKADFGKTIKQSIVYTHKGKELIFADESMFQNIVNNLISNSAKFSPTNSTIYLNTSVSETHFLMSVKDSGIGISETDQKQLMKRFFRGVNVGNIPGTGLGLHIVGKYAEMMKAKIECISELNNGTEFIFTFQI